MINTCIFGCLQRTCCVTKQDISSGQQCAHWTWANAAEDWPISEPPWRRDGQGIRRKLNRLHPR